MFHNANKFDQQFLIMSEMKQQKANKVNDSATMINFDVYDPFLLVGKFKLN